MAAAGGSLSNFRNPFGLVTRMLFSRQRAAYSALLHEACRQLARPMDLLLARAERRIMATSTPSAQPLLMIVGAPRSGTTLVYQTLARYLNATYFTNLTSMFPRAPIEGSRRFSWLQRRRSADFHNFYGQTSGLAGPSDGFAIWNRWLGNDRYVPDQSLTAAQRAEMQRFFGAWCCQSQRPFLNKNNRNTACVALLADILPASHFIVVRRNPLMVVQSLLLARERVQGSKAAAWGLHAHDSEVTSDPLAFVDDVCRQVLQIDRQLDRDLSTIAPSRIIEITYEGFCEDPADAVRLICSRVTGVTSDSELVRRELRPFRISETNRMSPEELERATHLLSATTESTSIPSTDSASPGAGTGNL